MTQILIVDAAHEAAARLLFPGMMVQASNALADLNGETDAILWCHNAALVAEDFCRSAARVRIVNDAKYPPSFNNDVAARHYVRHGMTVWKATESPPAGNGHDPAPEPPPEAREAPAPSGKTVATVTPITEARARQQEKPAPEPLPEYLPLSDDAMAASFTAAHPQLRHVARWGRWLEWTDSAGWVEDLTLNIYNLARRHCSMLADLHAGAPKSALMSARSATKRAAVEALARADRTHAVSAEIWDADKWKLNTPAGLVDLTTGNVRPTRMDDYCRKRTAVAPAGACPRWLSFLRESTAGDDALIGYLQRLAGYALTGETREQQFTFMYGPGGNGKGTFLHALQHVMGSYATNVSMEAITEQRGERHPTELARLAGARLCVAQETEQGRRWAESRIKMLTGGDKVTARFMRQDEFEFVPELKLIIAGNNKPPLRNVDAAMRRRLHIVPFVIKPATVDTRLGEALQAEAGGILQWMIEGCLLWQCDGLAPPASVLAATEQYFDDQDIIGQWIGDCCEDGNGCSSGLRTLHASYVKFCKGREEYFLRQGEFKDALLTRTGITEEGYAKSKVIQGIRVRVDTESSTHAAGNGYMPD